MVSPGVSGVIFTLVLVQWYGSLLASNAHLGDSPLARASHCIMPRTDLYTRLHCVAICITVSSIAQCTWHPICGRALYNAHHQRDSKMCTNIYIICIKAISISALDKQLQKCCNIYNAKCSLGSFEHTDQRLEQAGGPTIPSSSRSGCLG